MKNNEIQQLIDIRTFLIHRYQKLDGRGNASAAVMKQKDVAYIIEHAVKSLDHLLESYVDIQKR